MDNPWSSGFNKVEMIPPVPAPRYKRKFITNEDSKYILTEQNTCVNVQACNIMPPPRRKNKIHTYHNKSISLLNVEDIDLGNRVNDITENNGAFETGEFVRDQAFSSISGKQNLEQSNSSSDLFNVIVEPNCVSTPPNENTYVDENIDVDIQLINVTPLVDSEMSFNIFENFIEGKVDFPIQNKHGSLNGHVESMQPAMYCYENEKRDENRVNNSISENSATIVGVFYKTESSVIRDEQLSITLVNNDDSDGYFNNTNQAVIDMSEAETIKPSKTLVAKYSEENDSGVYFSDNKSPPHTESDELKIHTTNTVKEVELPIGENDLESCLPCLSSIHSDIADNKDLNDLGPPNYRTMLDYFEARTVNDFHNEITSRFSLLNEDINKREPVDGWVTGEECLVKKRYNNLSQYLRNMLVSEDNIDLPSPTPLCKPDEENLSCLPLDDLMESKGADDVLGRKSAIDVYFDSSSLTTQEARRIDPSVKTNVNNNVHSCFEVTSIDRKITDFSDDQSQKTQIEDTCYITFNEEKIISDGEYNKDVMIEKSQINYKARPIECLAEETACQYLMPSMSIRSGAVNSLIYFFENLKNQENIPAGYNDDYSLKSESDDTIFDSRAVDQASLLESNSSSEIMQFFQQNNSNETNVQNIEDAMHSNSNLGETKTIEVSVLIDHHTEASSNGYNNESEHELDEKQIGCDEPLINLSEGVETIFDPGAVYEASLIESNSSTESVQIFQLNNLNETNSHYIEDATYSNSNPGENQTMEVSVVVDHHREASSNGYNNESEHQLDEKQNVFVEPLINLEDNKIDELTVESNPLSEIVDFQYLTDCETSSLSKNIEEDIDSDHDHLKNVVINNSANGYLLNDMLFEAQMNEKEEFCGDGAQDINSITCSVINETSIDGELEQEIINIHEESRELGHDNDQAGHYYLERDDDRGSKNKFDEHEALEVPTVLNNTKELISFNKHIPNNNCKPKTIPVVVLTEVDMESYPVGSIELYSRKAPKEYNTDDHSTLHDDQTSDGFYTQCSEGICDETLLKDTISVVLEKNWGSIGLKIRGDEDGLVISDILDGGPADQSGLVFKGWVDMRHMKEETEIFC